MASNKFSVINIQNDDQEIDLQFQDFGQTVTEKGHPDKEEQTVYFSEFPDSAVDDPEQKLLEDESETTKASSHSFWSFEYYQQFFDVESKQVGDRIIWSVIPKPGVNYLQSYIRPNPDLYGPFWVCITLILTTAISGNLSDYLQTSGIYHWKYDFHKVTLAASLICSYAWLIPIMLWGVLLWRGSKGNLSLLELVCIYGYSLSIFVPVSILWMIPLPWLQWCLGIVATVLSGSVLIRTVLPAVSHEAKKIAVATAVVILVLHAALALGFMLYFFYSPPTDASGVVTEANATNHTLALKDSEQHVPMPPDVPPEPKKQTRSEGTAVGGKFSGQFKQDNYVGIQNDVLGNETTNSKQSFNHVPSKDAVMKHVEPKSETIGKTNSSAPQINEKPISDNKSINDIDSKSIDKSKLLDNLKTQ